MPPCRRDGACDEASVLTLNDMAGPYSRSKYLAEQAAMTAAADGQQVVIVNPTLPIGAGDYNYTPPTADSLLAVPGIALSVRFARLS